MFRRVLPLSGLTALLALTACASGSAQVQVGSSSDVELDGDTEEHDLESLEGDGTSENEEKPKEGSTVEDTPAAEEKAPEPREALLARAALHGSAPPENHLGLAMAVSERASDLPWVLAIENRSPEPVTLAALPKLLKAEITPPPAEATGDEEPEDPETVTCGGDGLPKSLDSEQVVRLAPGQLLLHAFDPRDLCEGEAPLKEGSKVKVSYGFPTQTKKLWKNGKLTTVEVEQTAPFVAEKDKTEDDEYVPLKHLIAEEFTLDETYPLSEVKALPDSEQSSDDEEDAKERRPPRPLKVTISPLGTSSAPEQKTVEVRVTNTSGKKMTLFLRRELFTYEVMGPSGGSTCHMHPAARSPDAAAFATLSPGESRTLQTRLAEACPAGTWDEPGTYSVSALFQATASGQEHGLSAFTGSAATTTSARLIVPDTGKAKSKPAMIIVSSRPVD